MIRAYNGALRLSENVHVLALHSNRGEFFKKEVRHNRIHKAQFCLFIKVQNHTNIHYVYFMDIFVSYKTIKKSKEIIFAKIRMVVASGGKSLWLRRSNWESGSWKWPIFLRTGDTYVDFPLTPFLCWIAVCTFCIYVMYVNKKTHSDYCGNFTPVH